MIEFTSLRHAYPEPDGIEISRPNGYDGYTLLHFYQSVQILYKGEVITTQPDAFIIFDTDTEQYFKIEQPLVHNWMHFNGDVKDRLSDYGLCLDTIYYPQHPSFITELVREIEVEFYGGRDNRARLLELKFEELLLKLSRSITGQGVPTISSASRERYDALRQKMFSDLQRHWTTAQMVREVGYSESRFHRIYKELYGTSPINDLINARVEKAKQLLCYNNASISEIAEALGYENTTHFIRQFKGKTGLSPTEYKRTST